jgi:hypothetical protein
LSANCNIDCPLGFEPASFLRNKCTTCECVPRNACLKDSECPSGQQCYAGVQCQEKCADPACCHGNLCASPGCKGAPDTSCGLVGCVEGSCIGACPIKPFCQCEGEPPQWKCKEDPSCPPSACK